MADSYDAAQNANIPDGWIRCTVQDIVHPEKHSCIGGPFGSNLTSKDYVDAPGIPVSRGNNLTLGRERYIDSDFVFVSERKAATLLQNMAFPGDLVFTQRGTVGQVGLIPRKARFSSYILSQNQMKLRPDESKANPNFLYYYFISSITQNLIQQNSIGSTIPGFNLGQLRTFPLVLPPLPEQKAVADVLGALDDKIESNRRTSRTLERLARAIFRAWFVDFEPVKAKAAGARSFPGMPQEAFDALPTRLVESELGLVPEGWGTGCIGDSVSVRGGGTPSTKVEEYWEGGTHCWLTPKDLSGMKYPILLSTNRKITDKGLDKISSGLLPVGTVLLSSRAPVGYLVLAGVPTAINQGFIAMVCDGPLPPLYVYHWTQSVMDEIKSRASGTTFPEISKTAFRPIKVCVPTKPVLESFTAAVEPLFDKLAANIKESQALEKLRDYLLPKLLSGEVRVQVDLLPKPVADKGEIPSNEGTENAQ